MLIDTHIHFYDPSRPQGVPWPPADNELLYRTVLPKHARAVAGPHGVTGTVVVEASKWLEDNQWILDLAAEDPFIVGLVGHVDPNRPEFGDELARLAANPIFRGIRCGRDYFGNVESGSFLADMESLASHDLSLDVLIDQEQIDGLLAVARRIPELRIVVNHIAHMPITGEALTDAWIENYQRLAAAPNVYMKVSALIENSAVQPAPTDPAFYRPLLDTLWLVFGQDRLIYGSNWPVCERAGDYETCINIVRTYFSQKGETAAEKYFWRNAQTAYKFVERASD